MTWTILYTGKDNSLLFKAVTAPHGEKEAWDYIKETYDLDMVAIISGSHNVYSHKECSVVKDLTLE